MEEVEEGEEEEEVIVQVLVPVVVVLVVLVVKEATQNEQENMLCSLTHGQRTRIGHCLGVLATSSLNAFTPPFFIFHAPISVLMMWSAFNSHGILFFAISCALTLPFCAGQFSGCFTVEGWKGEDGCSSRLFCDVGSHCNPKTGPMCKFGLCVPSNYIPFLCYDFMWTAGTAATLAQLVSR